MANELAYVFITPYTIRKSRTGGIIARYLARTDLRLVASRMFGPSQELVDEYSAYIRASDPDNPKIGGMIADYVSANFAPVSATGRPHRTICLLFEGEDAIQKIWDVTGSVTMRWGCGTTIRETYGDYITNADGTIKYFEPAVLIGPSNERAQHTLQLWARFIESDSGVIQNAAVIERTDRWEQTLVMLKPDNFRYPSLRAGNIVDLLSGTGLRMVGLKKFSMTVSQAEQFYEPVVAALSERFPDFGSKQAADCLTQEFGFEVSEEIVRPLLKSIGPSFASRQFEDIVEFMTGYRPSDCREEDKGRLGRESCLAIVYEGVDAVSTIRHFLGSTDPRKARPGSIRREFGSSIMVNAAHASDSEENALREMGIINIREDRMCEYITEYCK